MNMPACRLAALLAAGVCSSAAAQLLECRDPSRCCPSTEVPQLIGRSAKEALRLTQESGLLSTAKVTLPRPRLAAGTVYSSLPRPGARVCLDTPITVFVAGPHVVRPDPLLPDTVGQLLADALPQLHQARANVRVQPLCGAAPDPARSRVVLQRVGSRSGATGAVDVELVTEHDAALPLLRGRLAAQALDGLNAAPGPVWRLCAAGTDTCTAPDADATLVGIDSVDRRQCRIDAEFAPGQVAAPRPAAPAAEPSAPGSAAVPLAGGAALLGGTAALAGLKLARSGFPGSPASPSRRAPATAAPVGASTMAPGLRLRVRRDVDDAP